MDIITVENLNKTYETYRRGSKFSETFKSFFKREKVIIEAVKDISFTVEEGEIAGILGPNGAGKSTTIKMLTGTLFPTGGTINVMGYTPHKERAAYVHNIGAVFGQKSQLIWDIPPMDSFNMNKAIYSISDRDFKYTLDKLTGLFEVEDIVSKPTRVLSLGERMKCEFIMAMLHKPEVVFLDEPTIGLDVIAKQRIRTFIKEMNAQGTTFILTTHDLEDVEQLARKVVIINHGQKVFDDKLQNLQLVLGSKKIIHLMLTSPRTDIKIEGTEVAEKKSDYEYILEVNLANSSINTFIRNLTNMCEFSDISIKELPMEKIITRIYEGHGVSAV
ncbi:ABC transporter ATP-binding protein [Ruminiclostridium cellobioparum]|jgi:ABC-2 type transport system ATP-binding protein|uniref:ABC transporter ATP-binding protein n=1 Tax=Ruminiclostridium cellobioparum TaxID=29355 RepID=UPI000555128D|nr:ATP-binding cassette domain-containing protein [Ruminiclostridium cellobioparum]